MLKDKKIVFGIIIYILIISFSYADWILWDDFDSRKWKGEGWGGEGPTINWTIFEGKKVLEVKFNGTGNYGFWRTEYFPDENWEDAVSIQANLYLQTTSKKSIASKLEAKNHTSVTIEQLWSPALAPNQWNTINWKTSPDKDYSVVAMLVMNLEGFQGTPVTVYLDHIKLIKKSGESVVESFDKSSHMWEYRGSFKEWWHTMGYEAISHNQASSVTPTGAAYLSWDFKGIDVWAEIAAMINEDWSGYSQVRYDVYCSDTSAPLTVYLYDGKNSYQPQAKFVNKANTWQTLTWNLEYPKDFKPAQIKEFKCVIIDLSKHPKGEAYFDNIQVFKK